MVENATSTMATATRKFKRRLFEHERSLVIRFNKAALGIYELLLITCDIAPNTAYAHAKLLASK